MSAVRDAIADESIVLATPPDGGSLRSQPPQLMSDATTIALQCAVSIAALVNAAVRGSMTTIGTTPLPNALLIARCISRSSRSSTSTGRFGRGAPARTYDTATFTKWHCSDRKSVV